MAERRTVKLERLMVDGARKDRWFLRAGARNRKWTWFDGDQVPPVDAREAFFEIERTRGGWKVVRQVEAPTATRPKPPSWPRTPRTLAECRPCARLKVVCTCESRWQEPRAICRAFDDWTIEELQRAGYWRCRCNHAPSVFVHQEIDGRDLAVECWTFETANHCWVRA